jgi:hypothetical protein
MLRPVSIGRPREEFRIMALNCSYDQCPIQKIILLLAARLSDQ